jgi:hypothetical protein
MTKNIVIGVLGVLTLFFGFSYFKAPPLGAVNPTGPLHQQMESFLQGLTAGGNYNPFVVTNNGAMVTGGSLLSTTTTSTSFGTLTATQLATNRTIVLTPNVSSATTTLPTAALYAAAFPVIGQTADWTLINGTSTSAITVGVAAGTSMDLDANTYQNVQIAPNASAVLKCITISATSVRCRVSVLVAGD